MAKGKKYGVGASVRSIPEALDGKILVRTITATGPNFTTNLNSQDGVNPDRVPEPLIEGVLIKANPDNVGLVFVLEQGVGLAEYYPLSAGDAVSIHTDHLSNVYICIGLNGEMAHYIAIAEAT